MQTLIALLVAAAAACAIARPPGPTAAPASLQARMGQPLLPASMLPRKYPGDYFMPRFFLPHYLGYDESPRLPPIPPENDWLTREIERINQMEEEEEVISPYEMDIARLISQDPYMQRMFESPLNIPEPLYAPEAIRANYEDLKPMNVIAPQPMPVYSPFQQEVKREPPEPIFHAKIAVDEHRKKFALTPMDNEYYEQGVRSHRPTSHPAHHKDEVPNAAYVLEPPRQTRQNPNLSKQKHLLEPDLGKLKTGLSHEEQHKQPVQVLESASDPAESIYGVALIAAVGAALTMAIVGFAFGWYTLSKKAKAAADVDYPAYGVTGPTMDTSGDRKLAHSAHMYHYQHQKQQIIAMERNGMEQRAGSVSDPESEEENEEGDYTVYECPGFATTGDMEVKNPLFSEEPTPTTPGKCEVVKPQPKD